MTDRLANGTRFDQEGCGKSIFPSYNESRWHLDDTHPMIADFVREVLNPRGVPHKLSEIVEFTALLVRKGPGKPDIGRARQGNGETGPSTQSSLMGNFPYMPLLIG